VNELVVRLIQALQQSRRPGQAMVEYALLAGLISVVAILALIGIGTEVNTIYEAINTALAAVPPIPAP
jgi:Flp pilus assembly pilin Flp